MNLYSSEEFEKEIVFTNVFLSVPTETIKPILLCDSVKYTDHLRIMSR